MTLFYLADSSFNHKPEYEEITFTKTLKHNHTLLGYDNFIKTSQCHVPKEFWGDHYVLKGMRTQSFPIF